MDKRMAVVAIGGNSLIKDRDHEAGRGQYIAPSETCRHIVTMIKDGWRIAITHGNGPQVGFILRRSELAAHELHELPLDVCGADTQGAIGYELQQNLCNEFRRYGIDSDAVTLVCQTEVAADDPAFAKPSKPIGSVLEAQQACRRRAAGRGHHRDGGPGNARALPNPTKPIGSFMDAEQAARRRAEGWDIIEDAGRGWRRVVASPHPLRIVELRAIRRLLDAGTVIIAVGGGGIPVAADEAGNLHGVAAVIDKDLASALLAVELGAGLFIISPAVEKVALDFGTPQQRWIDHLTLAEARQYLAEGRHFAAGSMGPKIQAVISYLEQGGTEALITDPDNLAHALAGHTGTRITRD